MASTQVQRRDLVQGSFELGPRSLALLRRILLTLQQAFDLDDVPDLGKETEDIEATWPATEL